MRRALAPALGIALVAALLHRLASPDEILAIRDIPFFHLPLRQALERLAAEGFPLWNPWLNGGQPVLSNPNYAAFYPPTWLLLVVSPSYSVNLLILGHALLGFGGAWRLAREFGCERPAAALAAVGFVGGGAFISAPNTLTLFCGLGWLPWVLLWGDRALHREPGRWFAQALAAAGGLALQLLAGEPVAALLTALALACLALDAPGRVARRLSRLTAIALLAALLGAVQLAPTAVRLIESPRGGAEAADDTAIWSTPPERLVEWLLPRIFGDPVRGDENLYFGWGVHDRNYPYVLSIYPGLLVLVLAAAAMILWPVARRKSWILMVALGLFLACGRFNPLYFGLVGKLPPFSLIRYPEKFILLATTALPFAAALGWQRLLDRRKAGHAGDSDFPLALTAVVAAATAICATVLSLRPDVGAWWIQGHTPLPLPASALESGSAYLKREIVLALVPAAATMATLAALRWRRKGFGVVAWATVAILGGELWYYGHGLNQTVPSGQILDPPPLARALPVEHGRLFSDLAFTERSEIVARSRRAGPSRMRTSLDRLDPYSGLIWGLSYALNEDYDLMQTDWARFALSQLSENWESPTEAQRILGAWGVSQRVRVQSIERLLKRRLKGKRTPPAQLQNVRDVMPIHRFTPRATWHPDRESAAEAMAANGFQLARGEHWVATRGGPPGDAPRTIRAAPDTRLIELVEQPGRLRLTYMASQPTLFVSAMTFHSGWEARIGKTKIPVFPTALGQIGLELPAGEQTLSLTYRETSAWWGAALTLTSLIVGLSIVVAERRRRRSETAAGPVEVASSASEARAHVESSHS